jgi:chorismate-pyruvate lyase
LAVAGGHSCLEALFDAQSQRPSDLVGIDLAKLVPFERSLLVANGTVTQFIEAYTGESVDVVRLEQGQSNLATHKDWLELEVGQQVIERRVSLRGGDSGAEYVQAHSLLVADRLPEVLRRGLEVAGAGLGRLMLQARLETFRQLLWYGGQMDETGGIDPMRTYRVWHGGAPLMLIDEVFRPSCRCGSGRQADTGTGRGA